MSDPVTALGGAKYDGLVQVQEMGPQGMILLRGDLSDAAIIAALRQLTGLDMPGTRGTVFGGDTGLLWMSPDEALVLVPYRGVDDAVSRLRADLGDAHALVADVSDARAMFRITGGTRAVRETLAKVAPVDMAPGAFEPGTLRRTRLAQVAAAFWLRDQTTAELVCFRSVAEYVFDLLCVSGQPEGAVNHF